jgi:hypothetical protein
MQCEMKLRDLEKLVSAKFAMEIHMFRQQQEKHRQEKKEAKEEIARLQRQLFWVKMRAITGIVIKYKRLEDIGVETIESKKDEN